MINRGDLAFPSVFEEYENGLSVGTLLILLQFQHSDSSDICFRPFLREVYEGQFLINLKKGSKFPGLDIWV